MSAWARGHHVRRVPDDDLPIALFQGGPGVGKANKSEFANLLRHGFGGGTVALGSPGSLPPAEYPNQPRIHALTPPSPVLLGGPGDAVRDVRGSPDMKRPANGWRPPDMGAGEAVAVAPPAAARVADAWRRSAPAPAAADNAHAVWMSPGTLLLRNHRVTADTSVSSAGRKEPAPKFGESFHSAMSGILVTAQLFGLLPVRGVRAPAPRQLSFVFKSARTVWALTLFVGVLLVELVSLRHMALTLSADTFGVIGGIGAATAGAVFYGNALIGSVLLFRLAQRWPSLMASWAGMEDLMRRGRCPKLRLRFTVLCAFVMVSALVEHFMSMLNAVPEFINVHWHGKEPEKAVDESQGLFLQFLDEYCHASHAFIFEHVEYNVLTGLVIFVMSKVTTFTWNFVDLFLMLVSTGLAERFKQFNGVVIEADVAVLSKEEWRELREYFAVLSSLTKNVDNNICSIVFLSFGNNLYFICLQLLNGLSPGSASWLSTIYFFYSFGFLLGRTVMVTLITARINDLSKEGLTALFSCPSDTYNVEVARLQHQMASDDLALTGLRFFSITRNFMLAVAGAIATYEIVLLQFNVAISPHPSPSPTTDAAASTPTAHAQ